MTNFQAVRHLLYHSHQTQRTQKGAREIKAACVQLNFSAADTFRMFSYQDYADEGTGAAYAYRNRKGEVLWDFAAYQAELQAKK